MRRARLDLRNPDDREEAEEIYLAEDRAGEYRGDLLRDQTMHEDDYLEAKRRIHLEKSVGNAETWWLHIAHGMTATISVDAGDLLSLRSQIDAALNQPKPAPPALLVSQLEQSIELAGVA